VELPWDAEELLEKGFCAGKIVCSVVLFLYFSNFVILCLNRNSFTSGWGESTQRRVHGVSDRGKNKLVDFTIYRNLMQRRIYRNCRL